MGNIRLIDLDSEIFVPIYDEAKGVSYEQVMTVADFFDKFLDGNVPPVIEVPDDVLKEG